MKNSIIILPIEVKELAQKVSEKKQAEINTVLTQIFTGTDDWQKQVDAIEVKGIEDKMSIGLAEVARKNAKNARIAAEKIFDAKREQVQQAKSEYDLEDKLWLKAKQVMQITFKAIEDKAEWKANFVKRYESEQKELRTQNRILQVAQFSQINRIEFENMSDEVFSSFFLSGLQSAHEAKLAEVARLEAERIEKERIEAERIEAQRLENIRLKEEADKREREIEKERKANEQKRAKELAIAQAESERIAKIRSKREKELQPYIVFIREYNKLMNKDESEYQAEFLEIKKGAEEHWEFEKNERIKQQKQQEEQEKKLRIEQAKNKKIEDELKAKREAEAKVEKEKKDAEAKAKKEADKLAKAGDKAILNAWVDTFSIRGLGAEKLKETSVAQAEQIMKEFSAFKLWAKSQVEQM